MKKHPEEGDLVLITISKITDHAAFAKLEEYKDTEGMIHVSEFSSSWVRNIKSFLKVGQKEVALVIKADSEKGHYNLSLRRVSGNDKTEKFEQIKRTKKAKKLVELAAKKLDTTPAKLNQKIEKEYEESYFAFEDAKKGEELPFSKKINKVILEIAEKGITLQSITVSETVEITCEGSSGIEHLKNAIISTLKKQKNVDVTYLGAPRYKITIQDNDYKNAEKRMEKFISVLEESIGKEGGKLSRELK